MRQHILKWSNHHILVRPKIIADYFYQEDIRGWTSGNNISTRQNIWCIIEYAILREYKRVNDKFEVISSKIIII